MKIHDEYFHTTHLVVTSTAISNEHHDGKAFTFDLSLPRVHDVAGILPTSLTDNTIHHH